jgi:outer membrane murein-binding lipoprotein Lpp
MELFKLFGTILIDDKDAIKTLNSFDKKGKEVTKGTEKFTNALSKIGKTAVAAFSVGAVVAFGKSTIETTAKLQAMDAQFEQIFQGTEGEKALAGIAKQAKELGIHADRLTVSWNSFGAQFKGAGMDATTAMESTTLATRLAADSAAFYDKSLEDTSSSLASFLKGNFAAGDAIGVFTNAKQMDVKANELLGKSWADLTESERQWLLLDTVEKTYEMNGASGQAAREMNNWENVTGNLKATWDRFIAGIGTPLLEGATAAVQSLTGGIEWLQGKVDAIREAFSAAGKIIQDVNTWLKEHEEVVAVAAIAIGTLTAAIVAYNIQAIIAAAKSGLMTVQIIAMIAADKIAAIVKGVLTVATTAFGIATKIAASPVTLIILAIGALITVVYLLIKNWDAVKAKTIEVWTAIKNWITTAVENIKNTISNVFGKIKEVMLKPFEAARDAIKGVIDKIKGFLAFKWEFPKLKMPHFSITGSANPLKWFTEGIPKLRVEWYADGGIFNQPTIFNTPYGLKGVGEAGAEVVAPLSKLKEMMGNGETTYNIYLNDMPALDSDKRKLAQYIEEERRRGLMAKGLVPT